MSRSDFAAIILAAGSGTRMKSAMPKVMHPIAGRPMIAHLLDALKPLGAAATVVVIGPRMETVARFVEPAESVVQEPPRGTGDAVRTGLAALAGRLAPEGSINDVLVLCGDTPLLRSETMARLLKAQQQAPTAVLLAGMRPADPGPYGRLVAARDGSVLRIVEAADAGPEERSIGLCWGGLMLIRARYLSGLVDALDCNNAQNEFYLTAIVGLATGKGLECRTIELPVEELIGINTRAELATAEALMQDRLRRAAMAGGATLVAPETVFFSADTRLGRDVVVEPNVVFGPGVVVGDGVRIRSFSHIEGAEIAPDASSAPMRGCAPARSSTRMSGSAISSRLRLPVSAPGSMPCISRISATPRSGPAPTLAPARSPVITTVLINIAPQSVSGPLSARTRHWWRRSRSATGRSSPPAASSPATYRPTR